MMTCPCGADEFVEQRLVRPAGLPSRNQDRPMPVRFIPRYRYLCAECGHEYGKPRPEPKKRGRKPRTTQTD